MLELDRNNLWLTTVPLLMVCAALGYGLTTLGLVAFPGKIIESGIALSIAYLAAENLFRRNPIAVQRSRWIVTFTFGLRHGMGFAGLLPKTNLPSANLPPALVGFNLGVELGQLAFVIPAFLLLRLLERWRVGVGVRSSRSRRDCSGSCSEPS